MVERYYSLPSFFVGKKTGPQFTQLTENLSLAETAFPAHGAPLGQFGAAVDTPPSLREIVKKRLLNDMILGFANDPAGVVLLVDALTVCAPFRTCHSHHRRKSEEHC